MRIRRIGESKLNIVNYKDMNNWDPKQYYKQSKTGTKTIDEELGKKVEILLEKYDIIAQISANKYTENFINKRDMCFFDEKNLNEYRVSFGSLISFDDWCGNDGHEIDDMSEEEIDDLEEEYGNDEKGKINDYGNNIEFSVFLPEDIDNELYSALFDASIYLKYLNNSAVDVIKGHLEYYTMLTDKIDELKLALDIKGINITNKNIDILPGISYRLYKDSNFFGNLYNELGDNMIELFREWLSLMNEKANF